MHLSTTTIIAVLAANVCASPVPQIGGEAQLCQNALDGVVAGAGTGTGTALTNAAGIVSSAKSSTKMRSLKLVRRQGTGAAAACYDVVNNVDQGSGYTTGNVLDGATGNSGEECTTEACTTQNSGATAKTSRRQLGDVANGVQAVSGAVGTGGETAPVTAAVGNAAAESDAVEEQVGAMVGTAESYPTSDAGAEIGNAIGGATHARRQLNKIAPGVQNVANEAGVGAEFEGVTAEEDDLDGVGTNDVGNAGSEIGGAAQNTLTEAGQAVPNTVPKM